MYTVLRKALHAGIIRDLQTNFSSYQLFKIFIIWDSVNPSFFKMQALELSDI